MSIHLPSSDEILLFGVQGAGKGKHGKEFTKRGYNSIVMGEIMREIKAQGGPMAERLRGIEKGAFAADNIADEIAEERIVATPDDQRILLDGYPRNLEQLEVFNTLMDRIERTAKAVHLVVDEPVAIRRLEKRFEEEGRPDDADIDAIMRRIRSFYELTMPVIDRLKSEGNMIEMNTNGPFEEVHQELLRKLGMSTRQAVAAV